MRRTAVVTLLIALVVATWLVATRAGAESICIDGGTGGTLHVDVPPVCAPVP